MKAILKVEEKVILTLTIKEANWLKNAMQNPLSSKENSFDSDKRENLFNALSVPKITGAFDND